jgi:hypothetical protein
LKGPTILGSYLVISTLRNFFGIFLIDVSHIWISNPSFPERGVEETFVTPLADHELEERLSLATG